jgi:hypothetical protein
MIRGLRRILRERSRFVLLDEACSLVYDAASALNALGARLERAAHRAHGCEDDRG